MNKQKILCLLHMPPPTHGVSYINDLIINNLHSSNYTLDLLKINYSKEITDIGGFSFRKIVSFVSLIGNFIIKIVKNNPSSIYFSITPCGKGFYRDSLFVFIAKIFRKKVILHIHGIGINREIDNSNKLFIYRTVFRNTFVVTLSKSILHDLEKIQKVVKKIFIVNNGIPIINYPYTKMVDENFNITCLSTITPLKQQLILLKAISILKSRGYQNLRCKIAGQISNQPYYHLLKKYVSENSLDHQVDFLGAIWGDDKNNLLRDTDVFVFPTSWESFGLVVLEAFNFKIPVIGSNIGSIPEIIDNGINGFIIDPGNFEGIADKLEYLILNPEKREIMGNNGYIKLCENYSLERFISTLNTTFDEILNDSF